MNKSRFYIGESDGYKICPTIDKIRHCLIGGTTGAGKSNLIKWIIKTIPTPIFIIDPKQGLEYKKFKDLKKVFDNKIYKEEKEINFALKWNCSEIDRRFKKFEALPNECLNIEDYNEQSTGEKLQHIFIIIDEYQEIIKGNKNELFKIARLGRAAGIHLLLATQRPDASIPTQLKALCNLRIALQVNSHTDSNIILNDKNLHAEKLKNAGDFILKINGESLTGHTPLYY